jgi:glycosyltransferase involved in cell wall biosynthesis
VPVEALAGGTPVVSTPGGMMKELLREGAIGFQAGFDVASLADALARGLADEERRRALGRAACADVQRFEYERVLAEYAAGLQRLAGSNA